MMFANIFKTLKKIIFTARSFLFAIYYPRFVEAIYNYKVIPFKKEVCADIDTIVPSDKQSGQIRILEVGVGPGIKHYVIKITLRHNANILSIPGFNLDFFPKNCRLIALDKNAHFEKVLNNNLLKVMFKE